MKIEKVEKLIANLHDKIKYVIDIRNSKRKLNHRLVLKKAHRVIRFNQSSWLKPVIDMNTDLRRKAKKKDFEKGVLKSMNNGVFRKTMKNVRKHRKQTFHNRMEKKLFGVGTKLPYYNVFHGISISNRNEQHADTC